MGVPVTKLGRLVKEQKINSMEDIYLHSLPVKEYQIIDQFFAPGTLKDEVMKIHPVQKMTSAGQTNRFVCYVLVGDTNGHIGLGNKCAKEVATAIRGGIISAKMALIPVRRGYWGGRIGNPHTVPFKVHGKCGSVHVRWSPRLLLGFQWYDAHYSQLHESLFRGITPDVHLPDARPLEAHTFREASIPRVV